MCVDHAEELEHVATQAQNDSSRDLASSTGITVVDLGCGFGALARELASTLESAGEVLGKLAIRRYVAVDKSPVRLQRAVDRARVLGFTTERFELDLDTGEGQVPPPGIGDILVCAFTITHLRDAASGLRQAARLVRDDGIILVVDSNYAAMTAAGDSALLRTVAELQALLRHRDLDELDGLARLHGLRPLSGLENVSQHFGPRELSPKGALGFVGLFDPSDPVRLAWERIEGGNLTLTHIQRAYVKHDLSPTTIDQSLASQREGRPS